MVFLLIIFYLFFFGFFSVIVFRNNVILVLICIELMLLGVNFGFLFYSLVYDDIFLQIVSILILTLAALEASIGLSIIVIYYRLNSTVNLYTASLFKFH